MKFSKTRQVKSPQRGTPQSAGIDFFIPSFTKKFITDLLQKNPRLATLVKTNSSYIVDNTIVLMPHDRILIPSGIHVNFTEEENLLKNATNLPLGLSLNAANKSGIGSKRGVSYLAQIIDSDYEGEIHINLVNTGAHPVQISEGEKIIQFLLQPVYYAAIEEVSFDDLYINSTSQRGSGGFGSTNK